MRRQEIPQEVINADYILTSKPTLENFSPVNSSSKIFDVMKNLRDIVKYHLEQESQNELNERKPNYSLIYCVIACFINKDYQKFVEKLENKLRPVDIETFNVLFHNMLMTLTTQVFQEKVKIPKEYIRIEKNEKLKKELSQSINKREEEEDYTELNMMNINQQEFENIFSLIDDEKYGVDEIIPQSHDGIPQNLLDPDDL